MSQEIKFSTRRNKVKMCYGDVDLFINFIGGSGIKGAGINQLKQAAKHIPVVNDGKTKTVKKIIRTEHRECGCCPTTLTALVQVECENGVMTEEWKKVQGLYRIILRIPLRSDHESTMRIERLDISAVILNESTPKHTR